MSCSLDQHRAPGPGRVGRRYAQALGMVLVGLAMTPTSVAGQVEEVPSGAALTAWLAATPELGEVVARAADLRERAPLRLDLHQSLGRHLVQRRAFEAGAEALEAALGAGDASLRLLLAATYWELERASEARAQFETALIESSKETRPIVQRQFAEFLLWQGDATRATEVLNGLLAKRPDDGAVRLLRGRALYAEASNARATGDTESVADLSLRARRDLEMAVRLRPQDAEVRYVLARVLRLQGDRALAADQLAEMQRLHGEDQQRTRANERLDVELRTARQLLDHGEVRAAADLLDRVAPRVETLVLMAEAQLALGDRQKAQQALQRAVALAPRRTDLMVQLNELLIGDG